LIHHLVLFFQETLIGTNTSLNLKNILLRVKEFSAAFLVLP